MNRRFVSIASIAFLLLASRALHAQEKERISFDLKTHFSEKLDLAAAKNGTLLILMESDWGSVTELGEDYALWLGNMTRERRGDSVILALDVELRTGTLFDEGDLLASRRITVAFDTRDDWKKHGAERVVRLVRAGEACVEIAAAVGEAVHPVATHIAERVISGIELLMPGDYAEMKLEAMIVGTEVAAVTREMVGEMRMKGGEKDEKSVTEEKGAADEKITTPSPGGR